MPKPLNLSRWRNCSHALKHTQCLHRPAQNKTMKLNATQIQTHLSGLTGWKLEADAHAIVKTWTLPSFEAAVALFNQIAQLAKAQDHHPEVLSSCTHLQVRLWTHDVAGLTDKDFKLAHSVDTLFAQTHP
jgi:4a-hydroxytetrahydrobiopterin dehydratase